MSSHVILRPTVGYAFEQLDVTGSSNILTPSKYKDSLTSGGASEAFATLEDCDMRYTYDGTTPTSTVGHLLTDGGSIVIKGQNQMSEFRFISIGGSGTLTITYERL